MLPLVLLLPLTLAAVPPLTPEQTTQLQTADDGTRHLDEAALYPLLQNALEWKLGDEAGATVPDYEAILNDPDAHRGQLFLIEGWFFRTIPFRGLARPGTWEKDLQEWSIMPDAKTAIEVLIVDGPSERDRPNRNQRVRLPARFYKVWKDVDQNGKPRLYMVFVGRWAPPAPGTAGARGGGMLSAIPNPMVIGVIVLAGVFMVLTIWRYRVNKNFAERRQRELAEEERRSREFVEEPEGPPLPEDPTEAMRELERRQRGE